SETAFERLRAATRGADISAFFPDGDGAAAAVPEITRIDGVSAAAAELELFVRPAGTDYFPDYNLYARAPLTPRTRLNRPVIVSGRRPNPNRPDEMLMSEALAAKLGVSAGDTVPLESMTTHWNTIANNGGDPGPPDGPKVKVV